MEKVLEEWADTLQNCYGQALRKNKNDVKGMAKATSAILKHAAAHWKIQAMKTVLRMTLLGAATNVMLLMALICISQ